MKTKIIGIAGLAGSGKDTVGEAIQAFGKLEKENWEIKKFAGTLKQIASLLTGLKPEVFESQEHKSRNLGKEWGHMTIREMLQRIGTEAMRDNLHPNVWVNALFSDYDHNNRWIITDLRFPNELQAIQNHNGMLIKVVRPGVVGMNHYSETALDNFNKWDHIIHNDGTRYDLVQKVRQIYYGEDEKNQ